MNIFFLVCALVWLGLGVWLLSIATRTLTTVVGTIYIAVGTILAVLAFAVPWEMI